MKVILDKYVILQGHIALTYMSKGYMPEWASKVVSKYTFCCLKSRKEYGMVQFPLHLLEISGSEEMHEYF